MTLAERLDRVTDKFDHYGYVDSDMNVEVAEYNIKNRPEDVIEWLVSVLEEMEI